MNASFCWQRSWYQPNPRERKRRTNEKETIVEIKIAHEGMAQVSFVIERHLGANTASQCEEPAGELYDRETRAHQNMQS